MEALRGAGGAPGPSGRRWRRRLRRLQVLAVVLIVLVVAAVATGVVLTRRSWPETAGRLVVPGLEGEVRVVRDDAGIPQIYADTLGDLMLAQGFVHAQDRFFEMDVRRHITAGRLSELFGEAGLETDLVVRTLGWRRVAERELTLLRPATRSALDAYAEGVNAYLADRSSGELSLEYTVLGLGGLDYTPQKWTAVDSLAWLKAMAWDLRGNLEQEIDRALSALAVGSERAEQLFPAPDLARRPPIVEQGRLRGGTFQPAAPGAAAPGAAGPAVPSPAADPAAAQALVGVRGAVAALPALLGRGEGVGSNAWAVSGARTTSGAPILANDPHLGASLPSVWVQSGLHCRKVSSACPLDVAGFGFAGVPGIVIGRNRDIAWGFTNLGADVTDLYVERVDGDTWLHDGQVLPLVRRPEVVRVRGGEPVEFTVRSTAHGPLLSDLARVDAMRDDVDLADEGLLDSVRRLAGTDPTGAGGAGVDDRWQPAVSLAWTASDPRPTADALLALDAATDWTSFRAALADFAVPGQNVVYADRRGHIGYQATGVVPVRGPANDGRTPAPGWLSAADWAPERLPYAALPYAFDPPSGMVVTANQSVIDPGGYTPHLTDDFDQGFRSSRIRQLLEQAPKVDVDAMAAIQLDARTALVDTLVPALLAVPMPRGYAGDGQRLLRGWDGQMRADSAPAAYLAAVWRDLLERTFTDELTGRLAPDGGSRWYAVVESLLDRPDDRWWDDVGTPAVETRDDVLEAAMRAARDDLTVRLSPRAEEWRWGDLHRLELRSPTLGESGIGAVERLFNRGEWRIGGGSSIVDATGWDAREGYEVTTVPSMRMIVPLDDPDGARWINLAGASGHAFHPHYTDQTDRWARGETLPWRFSRRAVERAGDDVLELVSGP